MAIHIAPRGSDLRCPLCHDTVAMGPVCAACGARYHTECANILVECAVMGCVTRLVEHTAPVLLPRLGGLVRRLASWEDRDVAAARGARGGPRVVVLWPCSREVRGRRGAAQAVAELLGPEYSISDGRLRLNSQFPEPLVRLDDPAAAELACRRLEQQGVSADPLPLADVMRPLKRLDAQRVVVEPGLLVVSRGERHRELRPSECLVVSGRLLEVAVAPERTPTKARDGRTGAASTSIFARTRERAEEALFVFSPQFDDPVLLCPGQISRVVTPGLAGSSRWSLVVEALRAGAAWVEVAGARSPALLTTRSVGLSSSSPTTSDNLDSLHMIARLLHHARAEASGTQPPSGDPGQVPQKDPAPQAAPDRDQGDDPKIVIRARRPE
jgi:hypothetical protein